VHRVGVRVRVVVRLRVKVRVRVRVSVRRSAYAAHHRAQVPLTLVGTAVAAVEVTVSAPGSAIGWSAWAVAAAVAASVILFDPAALLLLLLGAAHAAALLIGATSLMPARQLQPQHLPRSPDPSPDPHQVRRA